MTEETSPEPGGPGQPGGPGGGGAGTGGTGGTGGAGGVGQRGATGETGATGERGRRGRLSSGTWVVLIVAALVVAGIGVQALLSQRAGDSRDAEATHERDCLARWADDLTATIKTRSEGSADLRAAEERKDEADDAVTGVFVEAFITQPKPPKAVLEQHFTDALTEFVAAKENLAQVRTDVETNAEQNPFPTLDLGCES